ncbi:unnamed protein product [Adineta steineri]|uniref:MGS-like domain-containing protein n=1 Tax=Adineta steineri TaxID=433720 RepID=A0A815XV53_9BILA|nr:unnamed protein product [Adineta steineri]CAF1561979.1 unnamed protein product [Adineta steineri]
MAKCIIMSNRKRIAIVAHDNKKEELINCLKPHRTVLAEHELFGTGTTGSLVEKELNLPVTKLQSGPLGGDQELGSMIVSNGIDILFFLVDPLDVHPHIDDVRALLRISQVWNIVSATTTSTIDFILRSSEMNESHIRNVCHLTQPKAIIVKNLTKPKVSVQEPRIPIVNTKKTRIQLPRLSPERKQPVLQQPVFKKC